MNFLRKPSLGIHLEGVAMVRICNSPPLSKFEDNFENKNSSPSTAQSLLCSVQYEDKMATGQNILDIL